MDDLWSYREEKGGDIDLVGFTVYAADGKTGKVDEASHEAGACCLVVATGGLRGRKVLVPAGLLERVDPESESVHLSASKDQVKEAPDYDPIGVRDENYRAQVAAHFGGV